MNLLDFVVLIPVTIGVVQAIKMAVSHWVQKDIVKAFTPLTSIAVGIILAWLGKSIAGLSYSPDIYLLGILSGLSASGLFDNLTYGKKLLTGK